MARRTYRVESSKGVKDLKIVVAFPREAAAGGYECRAEIGDDEACVVRPMRGVDAFEALMLALVNIGAELSLFTDPSSDRFTWLNGQQEGLNFPTLPDYSLNPVMESSDCEARSSEQ